MIAEFSRFGVYLKRLSFEYLESMRIWRNSEDVRPFMQHQEIITPEQHLNWFQSINNDKNFYFIAFWNNEPFGVFNIKNIDYESQAGETGSFLINRSYWESGLAIRGSFASATFIFEVLNLQINYCHILKNNKKAISFNKQIGFQPDTTFKSDISIRMNITKENFYKKNQRLINYLDKN